VNRGELLGFPASGRRVTVQGVNIVVVGDGLIREVWHLEDLAGLVAQVGARRRGLGWRLAQPAEGPPGLVPFDTLVVAGALALCFLPILA
jgi:hypothetical protein